jgi:hypothetical protein
MSSRLALLSLILSLSALGQDWQAGLATIVITPPKPVPLAGYAARTKPFEKVDQDVHAKALALKDSENHQAVLITLDLCILPKDVAEQIRSRIAEKSKLDAGAILLNVAHSHSAPAVSLQTATGTSVNAGTEGTVEYTKWLQDRVVEVALKALDQYEPAKLSWSTGVASFVMNRRQFTDKGVILGVNPRGLVDRSVPVLRIDSPDGKLRAVLFGYACHNTTTPSTHLGVSGDYAGYAQAYVEQQLPGVQAMFMCGCAGDSNPYPRQVISDAVDHGATLGKEVCRVADDVKKLLPIRGPLHAVTITADLPLQSHDRPDLEQMAKGKNGLDKQMATAMLAQLDAGKPLATVYHAPVAAWQFGKDLTLVALPNEVVVDYVQDLERSIGPMRLWVAGYSNEVCGYIPSEHILKEGGYETRGLYTDVGWFAPGVENALTTTAANAATQAGRQESVK